MSTQEAKAASPCSKCPWLSKEPRDIEAREQPATKAAALAGSWFCCHVRMGQCVGVGIYAKRQLQEAQP